MRRLTLLLLFVASAFFCSSQNLAISGRVIDSEANPIPLTNISISGANIGTITNNNGKFRLSFEDDFCSSTILISHINYTSISIPIDCRKLSNMEVILEPVNYLLNTVEIKAYQAKTVVQKAIENFELNYAIDSVLYNIYLRSEEKLGEEIYTEKEFVFDMYINEYPKGDFYIKKVRARGKGKAATERIESSRLQDIYQTNLSIFLRYLPDFLKLKKLKKYDFSFGDNVIIDSSYYYRIHINPLKKSSIKSAEILVHHDNYGIAFITREYTDEFWNDFEITDSRLSTWYKYVDGKWHYNHSVKESKFHYPKDNLKLIKINTSVVSSFSTGQIEPSSKKMGLMINFLEERLSDFNDSFWGAYNYIPLEH